MRLFALLACFTVVYWGGFFGARYAKDALSPNSPELTLADRINQACKPGYTPAGWEASTDMNGVPVEHVIRVQCEARKADEYGRFDTYYVAVGR